jgi:carboxyl-terminal processing protease
MCKEWQKLPGAGSILAGGILLAAAAFAGGVLVGTHTQIAAGVFSQDTGAPAGVDFSPVWKAWDILNENFVPAAVATSSPIATSTDALNQQKVYGMIGGLADSLGDPYTFFLPPSQDQQFTSDMSGSFEGIGMEIDVKDSVLMVISPLKGTPADKAGIKSGDQILKIDGVSTSGLDADTAVQKIRGPKGTQVTLTILRDGWTGPRDIKVTRDVINVPVVISTPRSDGIFVIALSEFTANAPDLFRGALRQFVESGDTKLILDLRGNPGGYLDAAVDIGSWFLPSGDVIVTEDYAGHQDNIVHRSLGYDIFNKNLKMAILVDKGSASASEILADALHYYGVGQLVGTNTFGKGVVQELFDITPGTSLKVTVARWLGPDSLQIPHDGITPDVQVDLTDADAAAGKDPQMDKAVEMLGGNVSATTTPNGQ